MMNPETNQLEELQYFSDMLLRADGTDLPKHWPIFAIGEQVVIKDYVFRIKKMEPGSLLLEPVKPALGLENKLSEQRTMSLGRKALRRFRRK